VVVPKGGDGDGGGLMDYHGGMKRTTTSSFVRLGVRCGVWIEDEE
jgi:hypothetical protein